MAKQKIEIEIDVPEGYEATGEFRRPKKGELILANWQFARLKTYVYVHVPGYDHTEDSYPILRKAEVWVQLTPETAWELLLSQASRKFRHKGSSKFTSRNQITKIYREGDEVLSVDLFAGSYVHNIEYLKESE